MEITRDHFVTEEFSFEINDGDNHKNKISLLVHQIMRPEFGFYVWPSAHVLSEYIFKNQQKFRNKHIIELGAGTSLPGLLAASIGGKVTLTDKDDENVLKNIREICNMNKKVLEIFPEVQGLNWGEFSTKIESPDIIIGADLFYDEDDFDNILATVSFFFQMNPNAIFITSYEERSDLYRYTLTSLLEKWNMQVYELHLDTFFPVSKLDLLKNKDISLFIIQLKDKTST